MYGENGNLAEPDCNHILAKYSGVSDRKPVNHGGRYNGRLGGPTGSERGDATIQAGTSNLTPRERQTFVGSIDRNTQKPALLNSTRG